MFATARPPTASEVHSTPSEISRPRLRHSSGKFRPENVADRLGRLLVEGCFLAAGPRLLGKFRGDDGPGLQLIADNLEKGPGASGHLVPVAGHGDPARRPER